MRKVLVSAYTCCPNIGSEPGNGWNWIMGYVDNGFHVHCITSGKYKSRIEAFCKRQHWGVSGAVTFYYTDNALNLALIRIPLLGIYLHYYAWLWMARRKVKRLSRSTTYLHVHHVTYSSIRFGTPVYGLDAMTILGPLGGGSLPHPSLRKYLGSYFYLEYFKYKLGNVLAKINPAVSRSVRTADTILVSNDIAETAIRQYTCKRTVRMYDAGVSEYFQKPYTLRTIGDTINILWIGRMLPRKGLNLAIEAVACLPDSMNYHFQVVGSGQFERKARKLVRKLGIQEKVTFLGRIPHERIGAVLQGSDILLFPSLIDSCPMQVFEAFAAGLPVVTLDHQGMKEQVVGGTGIKVAVGDGIDYPVELAKAIQYITGNPKVYACLSYNAYHFGQEQLWKNRISRFLKNLHG